MPRFHKLEEALLIMDVPADRLADVMSVAEEMFPTGTESHVNALALVLRIINKADPHWVTSRDKMRELFAGVGLVMTVPEVAPEPADDGQENPTDEFAILQLAETEDAEAGDMCVLFTPVRSGTATVSFSLDNGETVGVRLGVQEGLMTRVTLTVPSDRAVAPGSRTISIEDKAGNLVAQGKW